MIQVIRAREKPKSFAAEFAGKFGAGLGEGVSQGIEKNQRSKALEKENADILKATGIDLSGQTDPEMRKAVFIQQLKGQQKNQQNESKQKYLDELFGGQDNQQNTSQSFGQQMQNMEPPFLNGEQREQTQSNQTQQKSGFDPLKISDEDIARATAEDYRLGNALRAAKDTAVEQTRHEEKQKLNIEKKEREKFEGERSYHSGYSKELEKNVNQLRDFIPKKESALNFARNAIESDQLDYFSPDKLAEVTGIDLFRTAKGAQLLTAGKENLLSNMDRVSAKAQNIWFEQRLNSMFPKIGQSKEANLTTQEMLEGEVALDKAYVDEFDRLSQEDEKNFGYVKKDISRRVHQSIKPLEKHILDRTTYRMKEIEEQEKGLPEIKKQVGKNVPKGTPLTLAMAKLYKDKFGDTALKVAQKNGYTIPTIEDFASYEKRPQEFREEF